MQLTEEMSTFSGKDIAALTRPCVYQFIKQGVVLYVGMSASGLSRPISANHHRAHVRNQCDEIRVTWCATEQEAKNKESLLVFDLRPRYNR